MVEYTSATLDSVFHALADPTRRAILQQLRGGPATVTQIARPFPVSLNAISKHIVVLERAGLILRAIQGQKHHCHLAAGPMQEANAWLEHYQEFWNIRLDALERHVVAKKKRRS